MSAMMKTGSPDRRARRLTAGRATRVWRQDGPAETSGGYFSYFIPAHPTFYEGLVINYGGGGGGGGGGVLPYEKGVGKNFEGGGGERHNKFWSSFNVVAWSFSHIEEGGAKSFTLS